MTQIETITATRDKLRRQMEVARRWAYFDHAAVAPLPRAATDAMSTWSETALLEGDTQWLDWAKRIEQIRQRAATLVNADSAEIALVPNTTAGVNIVAAGMPWEDGDNVVIAANEFPTNQYPWINLESSGVEVRRVPPDGFVIDPNRIAEACDARGGALEAGEDLEAEGGCDAHQRGVEEPPHNARDVGAGGFLGIPC